MDDVWVWIGLAVGYLSGSVPYGLLFTRMAGMGDVRSIGSGNIGATNVLRTGNKGVALATLLGDALKATVPVLVLFFGFGSYSGALAAGIAALIGHCFPVWLGFKGGKGIATYVGTLVGFAALGVWALLVCFAAVWLGIAFATRYSSLAALVATVLVPLLAAWLGLTAMAFVLAAMALVAWVKHRENISRLLSGTETKIGAK